MWKCATPLFIFQSEKRTRISQRDLTKPLQDNLCPCTLTEAVGLKTAGKSTDAGRKRLNSPGTAVIAARYLTGTHRDNE